MATSCCLKDNVSKLEPQELAIVSFMCTPTRRRLVEPVEDVLSIDIIGAKIYLICYKGLVELLIIHEFYIFK